MTGDRAEFKSVNTSSQTGTRHPNVHCVANLALRTEEKGLSHPGAGPHPTANLRSIIIINIIIFIVIIIILFYFILFIFFLKQQSRQHRTWICLSNSCSPNCLPTTLWVWWYFNRTAPYRTLCTLCVITSRRRSQDAGLDEAHHGSGQHARVI